MQSPKVFIIRRKINRATTRRSVNNRDTIFGATIRIMKSISFGSFGNFSVSICLSGDIFLVVYLRNESSVIISESLIDFDKIMERIINGIQIVVQIGLLKMFGSTYLFCTKSSRKYVSPVNRDETKYYCNMLRER